MRLWPSGEGIWLRTKRAGVRIPPGVHFKRKLLLVHQRMDTHGALAHPVEHLLCKQKAKGSSPLGSTTTTNSGQQRFNSSDIQISRHANGLEKCGHSAVRICSCSMSSQMGTKSFLEAPQGSPVPGKTNQVQGHLVQSGKSASLITMKSGVQIPQCPQTCEKENTLTGVQPDMAQFGSALR